jgi:hypothetical protein
LYTDAVLALRQLPISRDDRHDTATQKRYEARIAPQGIQRRISLKMKLEVQIEPRLESLEQSERALAVAGSSERPCEIRRVVHARVHCVGRRDRMGHD